jgi:cell wall-associated NlpC family hydrolase
MSPSPRAIVRALLLGAMPMVLGACTLVGGIPANTGAPPAAPRAPATTEPYAAARPVDGTTTAAPAEAGRSAEITAQVVDAALESIGTPYEWGGTDANGFDCSGLIQFAYAKLGIRLPRTSAAQIRSGTPVPAERARLLPGDVLGFSAGGSGRTDHVGLYVGADEFIHSSSSGVRVSSLRNSYWRESLVAARRIVE